MLIRDLHAIADCQDSTRTSRQLDANTFFVLLSYEILNRRVLQPSAVAQRDRPWLRKIRFYLEGGSPESAAMLFVNGIHIDSFRLRVNDKILFSFFLFSEDAEISTN